MTKILVVGLAMIPPPVAIVLTSMPAAGVVEIHGVGVVKIKDRLAGVQSGVRCLHRRVRRSRFYSIGRISVR